MAKELRAGWMVGVVPSGVVVVGPRVKVEIAFPAGVEAAAVVAAVVGGGEPSLDDEARTTLRTLLDDHGALTDLTAEPRPPGCSLAAAVSAALADEPPGGLIWTAEEALVLPPCLSARTRTRALRAFVAGLTPDGRLEAYALLARGHGAVHGDVPDMAAAAPIADARASGAPIAVIDLTARGRTWQVAADDLDRVGAGEAHRLGPILWTSVPEPVDADLPEVQWCVAEVAVANLASPTAARDRAVQGVGDPTRARVVAHAEGAERFAAAEVSSAELVRARFDGLAGAVDPISLYARDSAMDHTDTAAAAEPRLWTPVTARDGTRRWAPAETVYVSVRDPAPTTAIIPWTSSGLAAGLDLPSARRRAVRELVERDAFMMAWLWRASRERVAPHGAPDAARHMAAVLATRGWTTTWVNLTLDTLPVILCCLTHPQAGLTLGAACDAQPAEALRRATVEALVLALRLRTDDGERPLAHEVQTPRDHVLLHRDPARRPDHEFLYTSPDEIDLSDIPDREGEDLEALLDGLGHAPLVADLSLPAVRPYRVVRALAPGLVPLTFGWRTEALGLPRLRCGAAAGPRRHPDAPPRGPHPTCTVPHPFP